MKLKRLSIAFVTALLVVLFSIPFMSFPLKIYADSVTYVIGDTGPAGGIIFYDKGNDNNGWRYLEAAPSDQSAGAAWSNITTLIGPTAQGTAIGTGQANTTAIINHGATSGAAWLCDNLVESGYSDWFLPSINELAALRTALASTVGDRTKYGFNQTYYWSSSEYSAYYAGLQNFLTGSQHSSTGSSLYGVRAVRAFSVTAVTEVTAATAILITEKPLSDYEETDSGFVTLLYNRIFGRAPDVKGLDGWVAALESGALTRMDLVNNFIFSEECQNTISGYTNEQFITFLYQALFNREADSGGFNNWLARMSAGMTKEEVINAFTHSLEFESLY